MIAYDLTLPTFSMRKLGRNPAKLTRHSNPLRAVKSLSLQIIGRDVFRQTLFLQLLPTDVLYLIFEQLEYDIGALRSIRHTCKQLEAIATQILFRTILIYQEPSSWGKLNEISIEPRLCQHVRTVEIAMIGLLPQSWYQEPCFHIWSKRTKDVAGKNYCKSKLTIQTSSWHWTLFLNRRKFLEAKDRFKSFVDWLDNERLMVMNSLGGNGMSQPTLNIHKFKNLRQVRTIDSKTLRRTVPGRRGVGQYHKRERECWVEDSWHVAGRADDQFVPWSMYQLIEAFLDDPNEIVFEEEYEATYSLWARNTHLYSVLKSAVGRTLTSLTLSNMSEILSTELHPHQLDPDFFHVGREPGCIPLRHLALDFGNSSWDDLHGILSDSDGGAEQAESVPWKLACWCKAVNRLESLRVTQNPDMRPCLDLVGLLTEHIFAKLKTVRFEHITTRTSSLVSFLNSHRRSLKEVNINRPLMSADAAPSSRESIMEKFSDMLATEQFRFTWNTVDADVRILDWNEGEDKLVPESPLESRFRAV